MAWWHKPDPPDMEGYAPGWVYNGPDPDAYKRYAERKNREARENKLAWEQFQKEKKEKDIQMKNKLKEASILFFVQILMYSIWCINFRAVADAHYHTAALSDFLIASMNFFVIKKIANSQDNIHQWAGYALGSVVGSYLGIWISATFLGG
jgi:hypothetical protein